MKGRIHKGWISAVVATAFASLWAVPVTCDQARTAAGNWLRSDPGLGCQLGQSVDSARTCATTNGVNFHVVKLVGGGFIVMSADTTQEPVAAFSDSSDLVESADNPLWGILLADFSRRARATNAVSRAIRGQTATEAKWAVLLSNVPVARAGNGLASVSDIRVDEILQSKWGQSKNSFYSNRGENCYNLYTPSNYLCGCAATAMAQIMRHHRFPAAARQVTRTCMVAGATFSFSTSGTAYDWANMKLIPEAYPYANEYFDWYAGGATSTERAAIGKLTYECGIAMQMQWNVGASSSYGAFAFEPLTNVFCFANAYSYFARDSGTLSIDLVKQIMLPNLDAGYPVMLGIAGHEVVADGYGFSDGQLYTHLNMGWNGIDNAWYHLPNVETATFDYSSTIVDHLVYNIFPSETGELLSGRVVDANDNPIEDALVSVTLASADTVLATTNTNGRGIYAFRLPGGTTYRVTASYGTARQSTGTILLNRSVNPSSVNLFTAAYNTGNMAAGNSWGNDIVLSVRTLYVDAAVPATSQQDGLTATTAFHDLPAAMAILQDGDMVLVAPGTYSPAVVTASNVTIKATGTVAETIIDGGGTNACCSVDLENDSASGMFEGFTLVNGGGVDFANENGVRYCHGGGALFVTLTRCVISNCVAEVGGGAHGCDLRNCLIASNTAGYYAGGASQCSLFGCTVYGNAAEEYCGGIDFRCVATNCIVWGNAVDDGSSPDFEASSYGAAQLTYSCSSSLAAGDGNLAADPKFRDADAGDFRLRPVSPCLDAATPDDISPTETDLSGNPRIQGDVPDMGAYEGGFSIAAIQLLSVGCTLYSAAAQTGYAAFACDSSWQASCDADWISFPVVLGSGDREAFGFTLAANPVDVARCATISLADGANNVISFQVRQAAAALPPAVTNRYFGLFVGLNEYDAVALRRLGFPANSLTLTGSVLDATNVCARFTNWGFCRREDAFVLTNSLATVSSIRTALTNIAAQAVAGDTVLYYHSGHGYLSTGTTVALVGYAGFYWDYDLAADLGRFADGVRVVVMADTCHSGGLFKGASTRGRRTFNLAERVQSLMSASRSRGRGVTGGTRATPRNLAAPAQIGWITAADYNQFSWDTDLGGRFTVACLEGWRTGAADLDGDGRVNFYDLWRYAKDAGAQDGETEGQCFNEELLMSTLAGVTDNSTSETETFNTPVRVPYAWLDAYMGALGIVPSGGGTGAGDATYSFANYAAAAERMKTTAQGQTIAVWQDFVAGTDPADSNSVFTAGVTITNGVPYIYWTPDLGRDKRDYVVYGREDLTSGSWGPTNAASRFFKVEVRMK